MLLFKHHEKQLRVTQFEISKQQEQFSSKLYLKSAAAPPDRSMPMSDVALGFLMVSLAGSATGLGAAVVFSERAIQVRTRDAHLMLLRFICDRTNSNATTLPRGRPTSCRRVGTATRPLPSHTAPHAARV